MVRFAKCLQAFFAVQLLLMGSGICAEGAAVKPLNEVELRKQEEILRSNEQRVLENYTVDRTLADYAGAFSFDFESNLAGLTPRDRWLDIGAGKGVAVLDYFNPEYDKRHAEGRERRGRKAQAVAISVEDRRAELWHQTTALLAPDQLRYLFDKRMRDYSVAELGRFQVITDMLGGFSYTDRLSGFMEKVLELLDLNGTFYTVLQDVNSEQGSNKPFYPNAPYLTQLTGSGGAEVKVCSWLKSISCVEVSCELKPRWKPPIEVYRVQKVCNKVEVPALEPLHFSAGTPPERRFRLVGEGKGAASAVASPVAR